MHAHSSLELKQRFHTSSESFIHKPFTSKQFPPTALASHTSLHRHPLPSFPVTGATVLFPRSHRFRPLLSPQPPVPSSSFPTSAIKVIGNGL
ncbi:unnamed protein product [Lactuca virosa]|uniref:Uncharacterized protein n=1 Tax=Lactuca virosa TaxID=75947 RepID=A0AAU9PAE9_9ASTR|nr:unnamed protein product [Lactuca virosa]